MTQPDDRSRRVVLYALLSLDGVAEEPSDWMFTVDDEIFDNLRQIISTQGDVLLGRGTHDYWVDHWPSSDMQPFADFINGTRKHVFTSTQPRTRWSNAEYVSGSVLDYVRELRASTDEGDDRTDIGVHGSITLGRSLLAAGLVDRLCLVVAPTLSHGGRRLLDSTDVTQLQLERCLSTPTGAVLLDYSFNK